MENCTIYSHILDFERVVKIVKANLPKAKVEFVDEGMQKAIVATIKGGFFSKAKVLKINYRQRLNPSYKLDEVECALTQNLAGLAGFIQSFPAKNEEVQNKFLYKVLSVNCEMPFIAEPNITPEFENILKEIVKVIGGFIFAQPNHLFNKSNTEHFVDENMNLIIDKNGNCEIQDIEVKVDSKYLDQPNENDTEEQINRKTKSESYLESHNIKVNKNLPCISSLYDTNIRSKQEVIDRTFALLIIAAKGEGIEQKFLIKTFEDKKINSLSPKETTIYQLDELNDQERAYATWRYESLYVMLWVLGKMDKLKYPNEICDVSEIVEKIIKPSREEFENTVNYRTKEEIIDELDRIYRMNWACIDARIKGEQVSGEINPNVVYERHYALNWLTKYENQDWDNVETDT